MTPTKATKDERYVWENELLGIMSNHPDVIDKVNFREEYFMDELHKKDYRYLVNEKCMNYSLMLKYMSHDEAQIFIQRVYMNNVYHEGRDTMAMGFAKLILEDWKLDEIKALDTKKDYDTLTSDEYYQKLTDIKNATCEPVEEELTSELIDELVGDDDQGIIIKNFGVLSCCLKLGVTDIVTVAATSGFGKSAFLLNIYQSLSQDGNKYKCHYFNLEVAPRTMIKRLLAITSDMNVDDFKKENLNKEFYIKARTKIQNDSYMTHGSMTIEELKAKVLNSIDQEKTNVVFVDHIGLLETTNGNYDKKEYDRVTYCIKELRNLALDNNLIIFVASQFDRASIKSNNISMSSLKSSGEVENSSTHVLLLKESQKRNTPEEEQKNYQEVAIDVAKNRNGERRILDNYTFYKTKQIFRES